MHIRRFLTAVLVIAGVLAPAFSVSMTAAAGGGPGKPPVPGLGIRLVDAPTATAKDPRARTYIIDRLAPGSVIDRRVEVSNGTRSPMQVSVYPAAASISHGNFIGAHGHSRNDLSTWTSTTPGSLALSPHHKTFVHVVVKVPPNAAPGERYGVVWAEVTTPPASPGGPIQVSRVGIRLYLSIGPGGAPASDFDIVSLTAARDTHDAPLVRASIHNTGGRALDLSGTLTLSKGPGGLSAGPFPIMLGTTLGIGQTEPVTVTLNKQLPNGPWLATINVRSGLTKRTAHATITFPTGPGVGATVPAQSGSTIPWWAIAAVTAAILLTFLILAADMARRRRRTPKTQSQKLSSEDEQPASTVHRV